MSNFTQDELIKLRVGYFLNLNYALPCQDYLLRKLDCMIDNYRRLRMSKFTKEELNRILKSLVNDSDYFSPSHIDPFILKIQNMIDSCQEENEIHSCHTALGVNDDFFTKKEAMDKDDLFPALYTLVHQCDGIIKEPGIYVLKLRLVKIK